jgi:hypothetical protein
MINLPEVHLGITRSHAEVEHKNLFIFCYKNHLGRFILNTKHFIIKDLHSVANMASHAISSEFDFGDSRQHDHWD